jgi:hypothetical protein
VGTTTDDDVLKEEVMTIRVVLLLVLVCGAGLTGSIMRPANAAGFTCPDTVTSDAPRNASPLSDLYSGATDLTAGNRLSELMADLRKSGMKPALIVDHLVGAYCPLVASDGNLSDKQKADRVRRFARQATGLARPGRIGCSCRCALDASAAWPGGPGGGQGRDVPGCMDRAGDQAIVDSAVMQQLPTRSRADARSKRA